MTIHWRSQAACRDSDPAVFFPGDKTGLGAVRRLCGGCPVQAACLTDAITGRDFYGFRGGHTGDERKAMLPKGRPPAAALAVTPEKYRERTAA